MTPQDYELRLAAKRIKRYINEAEMWPHVRASEALALKHIDRDYPQLRRAIDHLISALDGYEYEPGRNQEDSLRPSDIVRRARRPDWAKSIPDVHESEGSPPGD